MYQNFVVLLCFAVSMFSAYCLGADETIWAADAGKSVQGDKVYLEKTASPDDRAKDVIARMTIEEKMAFLGGVDHMNLPGNERLGLRRIGMADASQGVRINEPVENRLKGKTDTKEIKSISFPGMLPLAATWDKDLANRFGAAMGQQCKTLGVDILLGPGINMYRLSTGGRSYEYMGEDPYLTSRMVVNYVNGVQSEGVAATAKHFIANDTEFCRHFSSSDIDERTLREIYLVPWKAAIQEANVGAIMTGNHQVNGIPACMHKPLVADVLRGEYGFKGICMSDWQQTTYYQNRHELVLDSGHSVYTPEAMHFVPWLKKQIADQPEQKDEIEKKIDKMILPNLRTCFAFGFYDAPAASAAGFKADFQKHKEIARQTAEGAICLLKNEASILPFKEGQKILFVSDEEIFTGTGSGHVTGYDHVSYESALKDEFGKSITCVKNAQVTPDLLKKADVVLYNLNKLCGEGYDVPFELPAEQTAQIEKVLNAHDNVVVMASSCSGFDMPWLSKAKGLLWCFYLGQERGKPLAMILSGKLSPSGKMPITVEKKFADSPSPEYNFIGGKPYWKGNNGDYREYWLGKAKTMPGKGPAFAQFKANVKPGQVLHVPYKEGIFMGYRWYDKKGIEPQFAFGHGLSYTTFEYQQMTLEKADDEANPVLAKVTIRNTGEMAAKEVVQVYVSDVESSLEQPAKELAGFEKVELNPGQTKTVSIPLDQNGFKFYDVDKKKWILEPGVFEVHAGSSSSDLRLHEKIAF